METVFLHSRNKKRKIIFTNREEKEVLCAIKEIISLNLAYPILIGRSNIICDKI